MVEQNDSNSLRVLHFTTERPRVAGPISTSGM